MSEQGLRITGWRGTARVHPYAFDALFAATFAGLSLLSARYAPHAVTGRPTDSDYLGASAAFVLLLLRRRWPVLVLAAATVTSVIFIATSGSQRGVILATTVVATYTVASRTGRATAWPAGTVTALVLYAASMHWSVPGVGAPENVGLITWIGMATAGGDAVRSRRAYIAAVEERARRAEETREEDGRRRVAEERLRIARELHDVVAHNIAMINVQAGVAGHVVRDRPDLAEEALGHIRHSARTVLEELSAMLSVLRQPDEQGAPTEPAPGLARLGELLATMAAAGLPVEHRTTGVPKALPAAVDLSAYRIVQEALTNAHKHGTGATRLQLDYARSALIISVTNTAPVRLPAVGAAGGHGIVGMRERATAVGGTFYAGGLTGTFRVEAILPTPRDGGPQGGAGGDDAGTAR